VGTDEVTLGVVTPSRLRAPVQRALLAGQGSARDSSVRD
jgi:hypothetical protein